MQMTTEARAWLDSTVRRILARHPLGDPERAGITYELMSHLHSAGEARARAEGRAEVSRDDLVAALGDAGGEAGLAAAFVQPLARPVERVLLGRRLGAFFVDGVIVLVLLGLVHWMLEYLLRFHVGIAVEPMGNYRPSVFLPWGHHDPTLHLAYQALFTVASVGAILGYFVWTEGHDGRTLGKRALELRVVRVDGAPVTYREALLRNAAKLSPPLFAVDVALLLLVFVKDKQRGSDKIAQTIVIRA